MAKKLTSVLLALTLLLSLSACVNTETTSNSESAQGSQVTSDATNEVAADETPAPEFEEIVYVDDENCTFKITDIEPDAMFGYTLKVYLENKTDVNLMVSWDVVSVNGFMCDPFWANSVQAGKKAVSEIWFSKDKFEELGIEDVEDIEFTLSVYDEDDWEAPRFVEETFTLNMNE